MDSRPPLHGQAPPDAPSHDRLDSWKEIATYLRHDIRTAQRWEVTEGLPIHRHLNAKRGSVYAYKSEIDDWWKYRHPMFRKSEPEEKARSREAAKRVGFPSRRFLVRCAALSLAVLLAIGAGTYLYHSHSRSTQTFPPHIFTIGVLPLQNLSLNPDDGYIAAGLTEDLLTYLGELSYFRVVSVTSPGESPGRSSPSQNFDSQIHLYGLLEGSLTRSGERIQLTTRLVQPETERELWSDHFESPSQAVLSLRDNMAVSVVRSLSALIRPTGPLPTFNADPVDSTARLNYLKGRYFLHVGKPELVEDAIGYFNRAAEGDPDYAPAYSSLADSYSLLGDWEIVPSRQALAAAKQAASKAVQLGPALAESHASLGCVIGRYDWDFQAADRELREAIDLNPNYPPAYEWRGDLLIALGRFQEGTADLRQAQTLYPASAEIQMDLAKAYYFQHQSDAAIRMLQTVLDADPGFVPALRIMGGMLEATRDYSQAKIVYEKLASLTGDRNPLHNFNILITAENAGNSSARKSLRERIKQSRGNGDAEFRAAILSAEIADKDDALQTLAKAYKDRSPDLIYLKVYPAFDSLHSDSRFRALEKQIGLIP